MDKQDRAWADYSEHFRREVFPLIASSAVSLSIYSGDGSDFDVKQATEIGAALLLDKPFVLICVKGSTVPSRLARAADALIEDWDPSDRDSQGRLAAAIKKLAR